MKEISIEVSSSSASKHLVKILKMGGKITNAPNEISIMLNGLRYYSLEITIGENFYIIQGFEEEAVILHNTTMYILSDKDSLEKSK